VHAPGEPLPHPRRPGTCVFGQPIIASALPLSADTRIAREQITEH